MSLASNAANSFPRLYAAASLKLESLLETLTSVEWFSAALCRGLIEACYYRQGRPPRPAFSAALCRGLIEAKSMLLKVCPGSTRFPRLYAAASLKPVAGTDTPWIMNSFPRLYAAASLKPAHRAQSRPADRQFSAALCRGLIEARKSVCARTESAEVFRGFMPRPH